MKASICLQEMLDLKEVVGLQEALLEEIVEATMDMRNGDLVEDEKDKEELNHLSKGYEEVLTKSIPIFSLIDLCQTPEETL